jgi:DNA mismatch repair protein MutH
MPEQLIESIATGLQMIESELKITPIETTISITPLTPLAGTTFQNEYFRPYRLGEQLKPGHFELPPTLEPKYGWQ